jgi:hypothetical protein
MVNECVPNEARGMLIKVGRGLVNPGRLNVRSTHCIVATGHTNLSQIEIKSK